jgi:hypothetical protein
LYNSLYANAVDNDESLLIHNNGKTYQHGRLSRRIQRAFKQQHEAAKQEGKRRGQRITIGAHSLRKTYGMMPIRRKALMQRELAYSTIHSLQHRSI